MTTRRALAAFALVVIAGCMGGSEAPTGAKSASAIMLPSGLRRPLGLYAHVAIDQLVTYRAADWTEYLTCFYDALLANDAVSGLEISIGWNQISHGPDLTDSKQNDWSALDVAFERVIHWNTTYGTSKTIQLIVVPGFKAPHWLRYGSDLVSCDPLFQDNRTSMACDKITITGYMEGDPKGPSCRSPWPLPWSQSYQTAWYAFLHQLNTNYGGRPELVSIAMGGPTGTSNEMYVPHNNAGDHSSNFGAEQQSYGGTTLSMNDVMFALYANWAHFATYKFDPKTDDVFVAEWLNTISHYTSLFQNLTLILTPAKGGSFPDPYDWSGWIKPLLDIPSDVLPMFEALCSNKDHALLSCLTTAEIMEKFRQLPLVGNGKGSQVSGLGLHENTNFGIEGVRWLAEKTESQADADQIIGGAQFAHQFDNKHKLPTFEGQEYAVMGTAFDGTKAAVYFGESATNPAEPLNFLQIYWQDFATGSDTCLAKGSEVATADGSLRSAQSLFDQASLMLNLTSLSGSTPLPQPLPFGKLTFGDNCIPDQPPPPQPSSCPLPAQLPCTKDCTPANGYFCSNSVCYLELKQCDGQ